MCWSFTYILWQHGEKRLLASSCLSFVCSRARTGILLHGFSWNLIFEYFSKIFRENSSFITFWQEKRVLYMKTYLSKDGPREAEVAQGVPGSLRPRIFLTFRHCKGGRSSAKRTGRLYPRRNPCYWLSEAVSTSGHTEKNPQWHHTGNRYRDRPTSSAVP